MAARIPSKDLVTPLLAGKADNEENGPVPSICGSWMAKCRGAMNQFMLAKTSAGKFFHDIVVILILLNITTFIISTEPWWTSDLDPPLPAGLPAGAYVGIAKLKLVFARFEFGSVAIFSVEFLLNFWTCVDRRDSRPQTPSSLFSRMWARFAWCSQFYSFIDLCSILPYWVDLLTPIKGADTRWVRVARLFRLLPDLAYGKLWSRVGPVLRASGLAGLTVWVICASLYYMFEHDNEKCLYCVDDDDPKKGCWNYFQNIPYAMYYSLVNFFGEFPLIDCHSVGGRFVAGFIQVAGTAVMAIPAGAFGNALGDIVEEGVNPDGDEDDDAKSGDEEGEGDGDGDGEEGEEGSKDDVFKCKHTWMEYELDLMNRTGSNIKSKDAIVVLNGGLLKENRAKLEENDLPACAKFLDERGEEQEPTFTIPYTQIEVDGATWEWTSRCFSMISVIYFVLQFMPQADIHGNLDELICILYYFDMLATLLFSLEYVFRVWCHRQAPHLYVFAFWGVFDLCCVLPPLIGKSYATVPMMGPILPAFTVLRILKMERFIGAFSLFGKILQDNREVFQVTFGLAMILWIFFSTLMYYMEKENPDLEMRKYYSSVFTAMWITLLNLSGECPLSDYTDGGKVVTGLIGLVAVGFVSIPMGLLGSAFQDFLEDDVRGEVDENDVGKVKIGVSGGHIEQSPRLGEIRVRVHKFLEGSARNQIDDLDPWERRAVYFERLIITTIFVTVSMAALETMEEFADEKVVWLQPIFDTVEGLSVILFSLEYGLRLFAAPENEIWNDQGYTTDRAKRWAFFTSWTSLIDLLAIVPFYIALAGSDLADKHDGEFRMLRVFRLLTLEKYMPAVSLVGRVFSRNAVLFKLAGFAAGVLWMFFATLLWLTERHDVKNVVDDMEMSKRYNTVLRAMPYTLVHLTGDYPLVDYAVVSKLVLFFALFTAVGVVGVPIGLIASGFTKELEAYRDEQKKAEEEFFNGKLKKMVHSFVTRWRFMRVIKKARETAKKGNSIHSQRPVLCKVNEILINKPESKVGSMLKAVMMALIVLNVLSVVAESMAPVKAFIGDNVLNTFEMTSVIIFTIEYCARLWSAIANDEVSFSRYKYMKSFWGLVDALTIGPFWIEQILAIWHIEFNSFVFRVLRILRILQLEAMKRSFDQLNKAYQKCKDSLMVAAFLALLIWIIGSVLFYEFEKDNPRMEGAFRSIPASMYYVIIFLGGEWGKIDFTPAGKLLCIFYCIVGISICGIPVGAVFEAFNDIIEEDVEGAGDEMEKGPLDYLRPNEIESARTHRDSPPKHSARDKEVEQADANKKKENQEEKEKAADTRALDEPGTRLRAALQSPSPIAQQAPPEVAGSQLRQDVLAPTSQTSQPSQQSRSVPCSPVHERPTPARSATPTRTSSFQARLEEERVALNQLLTQLNATERRVRDLEKRRECE